MTSPMDVDASAMGASQDAFMVAERAVGRAANDLRAEFGVQLNEIKGSIAGAQNESHITPRFTEAFKRSAPHEKA